MKLLALETSSLYGSVAVLEGPKLLQQHTLSREQRTAQSLTPGIDQLLRSVEWQPAEIELVAVTQGPGSFTGLRAGVATAKTIAYAVNAQVVGVNTLDVIAHQLPLGDGAAWAVMDAQRRQVFAAKYESAGDRWECRQPTTILDESAWLAQLGDNVIVSGPALHKLSPQLPDGLLVADETRWEPMAAAVGELAWQRSADGDVDDAWKLLPRYYRKSAAEEKLETR